MKFKDFLQEQKEKHAVMAFGRMNPITSGHEKLVNRVKDIASQVGGSHHIILSHSQDSKKNPLSAKQKVMHAKRAFPGTNFSHSTPESPNFLTQAAELHKKGVTHLHAVGGSDRVSEFKKTLNKYNGTHEGALFNFKKITVHSAGERDPDAEGVTGMSASKMREHAKKGDFKSFKSGAPSSMSHEHVKHMYDDVRKGMTLKEDINENFEEFLSEGVHDSSIFKAVFLAGGPGSGKDYVLSNTLDGHGLTEINSDKALEFLMDKEGLDKTMPAGEKEKREVVRGKAKSITELRQRLSLLGRNGLIINGTGDDVEKIKKIKDRLEELGYDTSMLMVNTADDVSQQRNIERGQRGGRTVPEDIRKKKWDSVQSARPEFAKMFGDSYMEFDNSEDLRNADPETVKQKKEELLNLYKNVQSFVKQPPKSEAAQNWIAQEMNKKDVLPIPKNGAEMTAHPSSMAADEAKKLGLQYYGFGRYGKDGKVTHRSVHDKLVDVQKSVNEEFEQLFEAVSITITGDTVDEVKSAMKLLTSKDETEEQEESYQLSNNDAQKLLTLGKVNESLLNEQHREEGRFKPTKPRMVKNVPVVSPRETSDSATVKLKESKENYLKDNKGKVRVFMLRSAAAKEAHTKNGTVLKHKNGYVVKINEENENVTNVNQSIQEQESRRTSISSFSSNGERTESSGYSGSRQNESSECGCSCGEETGSKGKITLRQILAKKKEISESIDKGIEPGLSMAASGENMQRGTLKTKMIKKPLEELTGDETTLSIGAQKEDELKKVGIDLKSFKAKRFVG